MLSKWNINFTNMNSYDVNNTQFLKIQTTEVMLLVQPVILSILQNAGFCLPSFLYACHYIGGAYDTKYFVSAPYPYLHNRPTRNYRLAG